MLSSIAILALVLVASVCDAFTVLPKSISTTPATAATTSRHYQQQQQQQLPRFSRCLATQRCQSSTTSLYMASAATTIERPSPVKTGGPAVLERPETVKQDAPTKERQGVGHEAWEVRIYNDGMNTREHVARSLVQVTGMSEMSAYQTMMQAHQNGMAVVGRWCYEVAEMYHDALRKNGIICDLVPVDEEK